MMMRNGLPGVVNSTSTGPREVGTPKTVAGICKIEHFLVKYFDDQGDGHVNVFMRIGDKLQGHPAGEEWTNEVRPVLPWLEQTIMGRIVAKEKGVAPEAIPEKDTVNVTGSKIAAATKKKVEERKNQ